nr:MAG TPA: hypothetical protein [Caudoviricetes sp.]
MIFTFIEYRFYCLHNYMLQTLSIFNSRRFHYNSTNSII